MSSIRAKQLNVDSDLDFQGNTITNLGEPSGPGSPVRRQDVGENWKPDALVVSVDDTNWTTAVTLSFSAPTLTITGLAAGSTYGVIDGIEPADDDRVVIKDAGVAFAGADAAYNGIWVVTGGTTTSLTLERAADADTAAKLRSAVISAYKGTQVDSLLVQTADVVTLNTDAVTWALVGGTGVDADAIHVNVAGEIAGVTEKAVPVGTDLVVIEDSADSNNKKRVQLANLPGGGASALNDLTDVDTATNPSGVSDILRYDGTNYTPFDPPYGPIRADRFNVDDSGWNVILEGSGAGTGYNAGNKSLNVNQSNTADAKTAPLVVGHSTFTELAFGEGGLDKSIGFFFSHKITLGDIGDAGRALGESSEVGLGFSATTDGNGTYDATAKKFCALLRAVNTGGNSDLYFVLGDPDGTDTANEGTGEPRSRFVVPFSSTQNDIGGTAGVGGELEIGLYLKTHHYAGDLGGTGPFYNVEGVAFTAHTVYRTPGDENWTPVKPVGPFPLDYWVNSWPPPLGLQVGPLWTGARPFLYQRTFDPPTGVFSQSGPVSSGSADSITLATQTLSDSSPPGGDFTAVASPNMFLRVTSGGQAGIYRIASVTATTLVVSNNPPLDFGFSSDDLTPGMTYEIYAGMVIADGSPVSQIIDATRDFTGAVDASPAFATIEADPGAPIPNTTGTGPGAALDNPQTLTSFGLATILATPANGTTGIVDHGAVAATPDPGLAFLVHSYDLQGSVPVTGPGNHTHEVDELRFIQLLAGLDTTKVFPEFIESVDTPVTYAGAAGNFVAVKSQENGLEFVAAAPYWEATVAASGGAYTTVAGAVAAGATRILLVGNVTEPDDVTLLGDTHIGFLNNVVWDLGDYRVETNSNAYEITLETVSRVSIWSVDGPGKVLTNGAFGGGVFVTDNSATVHFIGVDVEYKVTAPAGQAALVQNGSVVLEDMTLEVLNTATSAFNGGESLRARNCMFRQGLSWEFTGAALEDIRFESLATAGTAVQFTLCKARNIVINLSNVGSPEVLFKGNNTAFDFGNYTNIYVAGIGTPVVTLDCNKNRFFGCTFFADVTVSNASTLGSLNSVNNCDMRSLSFDSGCVWNEVSGGWIGNAPTSGGATGVLTISSGADNNSLTSVAVDDTPSDSGSGTALVNVRIY